MWTITKRTRSGSSPTRLQIMCFVAPSQRHLAWLPCRVIRQVLTCLHIHKRGTACFVFRQKVSGGHSKLHTTNTVLFARMRRVLKLFDLQNVGDMTIVNDVLIAMCCCIILPVLHPVVASGRFLTPFLTATSKTHKKSIDLENWEMLNILEDLEDTRNECVTPPRMQKNAQKLSI